MLWRERDGVEWLEAELPGARAAFTGRGAGDHDDPAGGLNLGVLVSQVDAESVENRRRVARALRRDAASVVVGRQVHGAEVGRPADAPGSWLEGSPPERAEDGQATGEESLTPAVHVADCLPIALVGDRGVGMLHGGWRGLAAGIVARGVGETGARAAAVGPGIGVCCFEVGDEVRERFAPLGPGIGRGRALDLGEIARRLLERAGVEHVEVADACTSCERERFFSYRRDGSAAGRQGGFVWIENDG